MSFENVLRYHQRVNGLSRTLIGQPAFKDIHVTIPDPSISESGFIRATSWLYCLYFEAGRVSITFLQQLGESYSLVNRESCSQHIETVRCLRTELHHNLGFVDSDLSARTIANNWRRKACGTSMPCNNDQWRACYDKLVCEANAFLGKIEDVVRRLESDEEFSSANTREWLRRLSRSHSAADFDPLIEDVKYRLGREALDTVKFRARHVDFWKQQLDVLDDGYNFDDEATKLIEKTLLNEKNLVLPITGRDIISEFNLSPGPRVGELLDIARKFYESTPCSKEELLDYLSKGKDTH